MRHLPAALLSALLLLSAPARAQDVPLDAAGFTEHVAGLLRTAAAPEPVAIKSPLTLGLGELQANLDRIYAYCKSRAGQCQPEVARYVQAATDTLRERNAPPSREAVRVVVRAEQYILAAQASAGQDGKGPQLQHRPLVPGLVALPVLDSPRALRMLNARDNARLGLTEEEVFALGLDNLRKTLKPLMEVAQATSAGQIGHLAGDVFQTSRLLLPDTWAPLAKAQNGVLIVAIPATDVLLYTGEDTPAAMDALRTLVRQVTERAPNRLSTLLLRWSDAGWSVIAP